jgi:hypothetical protein
MDKLDENDHPIAFIPKAMINDMELAGLLARLLFEAFPSRVLGTVAGVSKSLYLRLTAAGTAPVFHRIPY